jgi:hypothetical protein
MPREYGQIRHDIWSDDQWRSLTVPAQHLYMVLVSDPKLTYCGVTGWHAGKLAQRSAENTGKDVFLAAAELSQEFFIVIDEETEEVFIRSYLRHESIVSNPRLAVTMAKDFGTIASNKIRAAVVHELNRLRKENPDWSGWEKPQVKTVLKQASVNPREMATDLPMAALSYLGSGLPSGMGKGQVEVYPTPITRTSTRTVTGTSSKEDAAPLGASYPQPVESGSFGSRDKASVSVADLFCPEHPGIPPEACECAKSVAS